jgi:SsrA-binding protein
MRGIKKNSIGIKVLSDNRSAGHHYYLSDRMEAGIALVGTEVKSAKDGMIQLKDAFGEVAGKEAWLVNAHISHYSHGNRMNHEVVRRRKLLLHRKEIDKLEMQTREKGLTVVPTKIYLKNGKLKSSLRSDAVKSCTISAKANVNARWTPKRAPECVAARRNSKNTKRTHLWISNSSPNSSLK